MARVCRSTAGHILERVGSGSVEHCERYRECHRRRSIGSREQPIDRYLHRSTVGRRCGHLDSVGQIMRIHRASLGQTPQQILDWENACFAQGTTWAGGTTPNCSAITPAITGAAECATSGGTYSNGVCTPGLPIGYNAGATPTASGVEPGTVAPSNTSGQTLPGVATDLATLCAANGGIWNATAQSCNLSQYCSLPLGVYNLATGACDYTQLYWVAGGAAAFLILMVVLSSGGSRRRR
jgi:hypothetical protein